MVCRYPLNKTFSVTDFKQKKGQLMRFLHCVCAHAGDFVDRGSFSVEVILTLLAWRVLLPGHMHMARGNHESKGMNKIYGFEGEVGARPQGTVAAAIHSGFGVSDPSWS